ncbi:putative reverse transcriptase domain-containing protein, partial [Tanacetum coccineum]
MSFLAKWRAGISVKKEAHVNFLTDPSDGRSTLRPAEVLVFGWVGGKHACVDLTGVSPLAGLSSRGFTAGQAALKAVSCKVTKHEKTCIENQHMFIPFAFDTFGFLAPEAVELLSRVQRVMHNNVMTPRSTDMVFKHVKVEVLKKRDTVGHNQVLEIESKNVKALYGRAQAYINLVDLDLA